MKASPIYNIISMEEGYECIIDNGTFSLEALLSQEALELRVIMLEPIDEFKSFSKTYVG